MKLTTTTQVSVDGSYVTDLLPVMLLGSPLVTVPRSTVLRIAGIVTVLTLLIVAASPLVAFALLKSGVENDAAYARLLMEATEREWHKDTDKPLKLIGLKVRGSRLTRP